MRNSAAASCLTFLVLVGACGEPTSQTSTSPNASAVPVGSEATPRRTESGPESVDPTTTTERSLVTTIAGSTSVLAPVTSLVAGEENVVRPRGLEFELMTMEQLTVFDVAAGGSREVTVWASDVGSSAGVWTVQIDSRLRDGATVSGAPEVLDFTSAREVVFTVNASAPDGVSTGSVGGFTIAMLPPDGGVTSAASGASFRVNVVPAGSRVGPSAGRDYVAGAPDGVVFDPLVNDSAGSAELDRTTLRIVDHLGPGSVAVTDDHRVVYVADRLRTEDTAIYEVCDVDGLCAYGYIHGWN